VVLPPRGAIAREAINAVPWWKIGTIVDPGIRHRWSEFQYQKSIAVMNQLCTEGNGEVPWMFRVNVNGLASFEPKIPNAQPDLIMSYDENTMDIGFEYGRPDAVRIRYQDANRVERMSPWFYRPGVDRSSRYLKRETLAGSGSATAAFTMAQTYLADRGVIRLGGPVRLSNWERLDVVYGSTYQIGDERNTGIIEQTHVDLFAGTNDLTIGQPASNYGRGLMRRMAMVTAALEQKFDPVTGAKWDF
jgi:hypothetical protein